MDATIKESLYFVKHTFVKTSFEATSDFFATEFAVDVNAYDDRVESRIVGFDRFVVSIVVGNFYSTDCSFYCIYIGLIVAVIVRVCVENAA